MTFHTHGGTPGPWHQSTSSPDVVLARSVVVAFSLRPGGSYLESIANARLIAAAPDLLRAAELVLATQPLDASASALLLDAVVKAAGGKP